MNRRRVVQFGMLASLTPWWSAAARPVADDKRPLAGLLLPLTGPAADVARSMAHAAALAQPVNPDKHARANPALPVFDTLGTPAGAAAAAAAALKAGAPLLLGPLFARELAAVAAAAGEVPVLAFSNDTAAPRGSACLMGVTAAQSVETVLDYARRRGVRRVAMLADASPWGVQSAAAATAIAGDLGLALTTTTTDAARAEPLPDAVLASGGGAVLGTVARQLAEAGVQLLCTMQATEATRASLAALDGAWLALPDPEHFAEFSRSYETAHGSTPGLLAGLAYDAVNIATALRRAGHVDREGLLTAQGFQGVTGAVRFNRDGSATRDLAVAVVEAGALRVVDRSAPA